MERAERAAIQFFVAGVGLTMMGVAYPLAFDAPKIIWQIVLSLGALLTFGSAGFLIYEYRDLMGRGRLFRIIGRVLLPGVLFVGFAGWYFWPQEQSLIPPNVASEFARARDPALGSPTGEIETTTAVYQASHEHAMVVSLLPMQAVFALPKDSNRAATVYHYATIDDDRKWWDDKFLRDKFKTPHDKKPPEYSVAELWDQKPDQLKWIGWREWSCPFTFDKFYYQKFANGTIFGILPTSETLGSSQIITFIDGGKWSAIEPLDGPGGVSAPACNENSARVNGVVIHGHHVKP